jgi:hypothetical protein
MMVIVAVVVAGLAVATVADLLVVIVIGILFLIP